MKLTCTLAALAVATTAANGANVALLAQESATSFSHYFEGNEIYDSADVGNEWKNGFAKGGVGSNATLTTTNTDLNFSSTAGGADWIEGIDSTNGTTTWNDGILGQSATFTWEIRLRLNDLNPRNEYFAIWSGHDEGRDTYLINETEIRITQVGGGFTTIAHDFTEFTTVRFAYDGSIADFSEIVHVWIDSVQVTQDDGNPRTTATNDSRLIIGDETSGPAGDFLNVDIDYFAYDVNNALAPIPETGSSALLGLGVLALLRRRRLHPHHPRANQSSGAGGPKSNFLSVRRAGDFTPGAGLLAIRSQL